MDLVINIEWICSDDIDIVVHESWLSLRPYSRMCPKPHFWTSSYFYLWIFSSSSIHTTQKNRELRIKILLRGMSRLTQTLLVAITFSLPLAALNYPVHGVSIFLSLVLWRHYFPLPPGTEAAENELKKENLLSRERFLEKLHKHSMAEKGASNTIGEITETSTTISGTTETSTTTKTPADNPTLTEANERPETECLICWSSPSLTLHCNHTFCFPCLDSYFTTHKSKHSCPVCSSPLFRPTLFTSENLNIWCNKLRTVLSIVILVLYFLRAISCACILSPSSILAWAKCSISAGNSINWIEIAIKEIPYLVVSVLQVWAQRKMVRSSGVEWTQGELKAVNFVSAVGWVQKVGGMVWGVEMIVRMARRVGWKRLVG